MSTIELVDTPYGKFLLCRWEDVSNSIARGEFWEEFLRPYMDCYSGEDRVAIDLGANLGFFSVYLARQNKKVYSFEAQKWVYWLLCANLALNFSVNVHAFNVAAYDSEASLSLATDEQMAMTVPRFDNGSINYAACQHFSSIALQNKVGEIPARRVDSIVPIEEPVGLIKCDVQGMDLRALVGAERIIEKWRPCILFEYEWVSPTINGDPLEAYYEFLEPYGYTFKTVRTGATMQDIVCEVTT